MSALRNGTYRREWGKRYRVCFVKDGRVCTLAGSHSWRDLDWWERLAGRWVYVGPLPGEQEAEGPDAL